MHICIVSACARTTRRQALLHAWYECVAPLPQTQEAPQLDHDDNQTPTHGARSSCSSSGTLWFGLMRACNA
jgi:hypothetical protein